MAKKKDTPFDYIGYRCSDLDWFAEEILEWRDNFKNGKSISLKELSKIARDIKAHSKDIKKFTSEIKEGFDKLTKN